MWHSLLADPASTFWLPIRASTAAADNDWLFNFILWVNIFFSVLIIALMVLFVWRYRAKSAGEHGAAGGHNNALEITWTVIPTIICVMIYYWGFKGFLHEAVEPPAGYDITVVGRMWNWTFIYPNGFVSPELHIPPNKPVRLVLQSMDVIHSLYIPAFRAKKDVMPGRYNRMWIESDDPGTYDVLCTAYFGKNHSTMLSKCVVEKDMDSFNKWLEDVSDWRGKVAPIDQGRIYYNQRGCSVCHNLTGAPGGTGPTWKDMFGNNIPLADGTTIVADEAYVKESILEPQAKIHLKYGPPSPMPSFKGAFKDYDIEAITYFMKSISANYKGPDLKPYTVPGPKPTKSPGETSATQPAQ